jgi:hypothetical protein
MYKIIQAERDSYITNKIIGQIRVTDANVGQAGSIDVFKLYDENVITGETNPIELSRGLIYFNLSEIRSLTGSSLDITSNSFKCYLKLSDIYGGQTTPSNFTLAVFPLSKSFDEGRGKDVVRFEDVDSCNFITASVISTPVTWSLTGANKAGFLGSNNIDIISSGNLRDNLGIVNLFVTQAFALGTEDLEVDITKIISGTIAGLLPDCGFRISFLESQETDTKTRFVKRFASRHAYDLTLRPKLIVKFDDSISDDSSIMNFNLSGSLFLYNYDSQGLRNINFESNDLTGSNCLLLKLTTPISGGNYDIFFTGSQFSRGNFELSGTYQAPVYVSLNPILQKKLNVSGSVTFTPIWMSLNQSSSFVTGSSIKFSGPQTFTSPLNKKKYTVSCYGVPIELKKSEKMLVRIHIFDQTNPLLQSVKFAINDYGKIIKNCYYSIRDEDSSNTVIPFDTTYNSTKLSLDSNGLYFYLDGFSLIQNRKWLLWTEFDRSSTQPHLEHGHLILTLLVSKKSQ